MMAQHPEAPPALSVPSTPTLDPEPEQRPFRVAVAIACWNEAPTIGEVVQEFQAALPSAEIHVFDNNSEDQSAEIAAAAHAHVHRVRRQGKGHVVRAIFDTLVADAIILVDGDGTYPAASAELLLEPIRRGEADMVVGNRLESATTASLRDLHRFGNRLIVGAINLMFRARYRDVLSGYRAVNRRFVLSTPTLTGGFEIETELTVRSLEEGMEVIEIPIAYRPRPPGSVSKLRSFRDGYTIMLTAAILLRDHYPLRVFGTFGATLLALAGAAGILRALAAIGALDLPAATLAGVMLLCAPLGLIAIGIGLTLNAVSTRFRESRQLDWRHQDQRNA